MPADVRCSILFVMPAVRPVVFKDFLLIKDPTHDGVVHLNIFIKFHRYIARVSALLMFISVL